MNKINTRWLVLLLLSCIFLTGCDGGTQLALEQALIPLETLEQSTTETNGQDTTETSIGLVVYVCGSVLQPGVYELPIGSRIVAAVEAAGGFDQDAATEAINLAEPLKDGMQVRVPSVTEVAEAELTQVRAANGLVHLNKASVDELCTLPGIGKSKAETIVRYRETNGPFKSTEEIQKVTGIGENLYLQIKDKIYID